MVLSDLNPHRYPTTPEIDANMNELFRCLCIVEAAWLSAGGTPHAPFSDNSGLRSAAQQAGLIATGQSNAPHSRHLTGQAADIADPDGKLKAFLRAHPEVLEGAGLWCEHWDATPTWWHGQTVAPHSGLRWFQP